MVFYLLNKSFNRISIIDTYESAIWTERYLEPGDFELYIPINNTIPSSISIGKYLIQKDSELAMIIESIKIQTEIDDSNKLIVTGRSLESILDRRILWNKMVFNGAISLQNAVKKILTKNIIDPSASARKISNFVFSESSDSSITSLYLEAEYNQGDNLLDVITDICETKKIGFKVILDLDTKQFIFSLYAGKNRANREKPKSYVEFSSKMENLLNTDYTDNIVPFKNVTLVEGPEEEEEDPAGDGQILEKRERQVVGSASGLNRREIYTDASSVKRKETITYDDGTTEEIELSDAEFKANLIQKGKETLSENKREEKYESEVDYTGTFKYGKHYKLGDIVQIINEYGFTGQSRVTEYIFSDSTSDGLKCYPKFEMIDEEG